MSSTRRHRPLLGRGPVVVTWLEDDDAAADQRAALTVRHHVAYSDGYVDRKHDAERLSAFACRRIGLAKRMGLR